MKQGFLMYYTKGVVIRTEVSVRYRESGCLSGVVVNRGSTVHPFSSWLLEPCVFVGIIARLLSLSLSLSLSHAHMHTHTLPLSHARTLTLTLPLLLCAGVPHSSDGDVQGPPTCLRALPIQGTGSLSRPLLWVWPGALYNVQVKRERDSLCVCVCTQKREQPLK